MNSRASAPPVGTIFLSIVIALALTIVPMPAVTAAYRPEWVALLVLYWCLRAPQHFGLTIAWVCGLMLDALKGGLLGQHAFALLIAAFIIQKFQLRIRVFPILQQTLTIAVITALFELILLGLDGFAGRPVGGTARLWPAVVTLLVWPLISALPLWPSAQREH